MSGTSTSHHNKQHLTSALIHLTRAIEDLKSIKLMTEQGDEEAIIMGEQIEECLEQLDEQYSQVILAYMAPLLSKETKNE